MGVKKLKLIGESYDMSIDQNKLDTILKNDDPLFLEGVLQRANVKNANNRIYSKELLDREMQRYMEEHVKQGIAYGELDHPDRNIVEQQTASHIIRDLYWKGDDLMGRIEVLPAEFFPCGRILRGVLKVSGRVGFSSRGFGSETVIGNDTTKVNEDFMLTCWDAVTQPSTFQAFGFLTESANSMTLKEYQRVISSIDNTIYSILK